MPPPLLIIRALCIWLRFTIPSVLSTLLRYEFRSTKALIAVCIDWNLKVETVLELESQDFRSHYCLYFSFAKFLSCSTHFQFFKIDLFTSDCHKSAKVSWILNNLSDFNKIAKQLMDDGKQKKHFSSKIQKVCSLPILAQTLPNSAQVLSWTYCFIFCWLRSSNQLKESV